MDGDGALQRIDVGEEVDSLQREFAEFKALKARESYGVRLSEKDLIPSKDERQQMSVVSAIKRKYNIVRVKSMDAYYYREDNGEGYTYTKADDNDRDFKNFVRDMSIEMGVPFTGRKIAATVDTLKESVEEEVDTLDFNIMEVAPDLYWDGHLAKLTDTPSGKCYIRLFDNGSQSNPSTIQINPKDLNPAFINAMYKEQLEWLKLLDGRVPTPRDEKDIGDDEKGYPVVTTFDFIDTWACQRDDVYMDMLKAAASIFMVNKPIGAFILTGLKRNGKSTYVKMLHTLLGRANTSALRLADLSSRHRTLTLLTSMMNAPDEETEGKDMDDEATANFKSMSAHEPVLLPVMYSPKPQWISTNFTMFCPMNTEPDWKGNSASACNQRSLIIPFHADLSKFDNNGRDFAKETFTPSMYEHLLAVLFAIATYYKDKPLKFSETMKQSREAISEMSDNRIAYAKLFNKWFVGFAHQKDVWNDYKAWCKAHDYQFVGQKELMFAIQNISQGKKKTNITRPYSDTPIPVYRLGNKSGDNWFLPGEWLPEMKKSIGDILYVGNPDDKDPSGVSVIHSLENWLASKTANDIRAKAVDDELS